MTIGGQGSGPKLSISERIALQNQVLRLAKEIAASKTPVHRDLAQRMLTDLCAELGIDPPTIAPAGERDPTLAAFWRAIGLLRMRGVETNHSLTDEVMAYNLPQLRREFAAAGMDVPIDGRLRELLRTSDDPHLVARKAVKSALTRKSVDCWVFAWAPRPVVTRAVTSGRRGTRARPRI